MKALIKYLIVLLVLCVTAAKSQTVSEVRIATGEKAKLGVVQEPGSGYQWYKDGAAITNAVSNVYTAAQPGLYQVARIGSSGCVSELSDGFKVVVYSTDVQVELLPSVSEIKVGEVLAYKIIVTNNSDEQALNVKVNNPLPGALIATKVAQPTVGVQSIRDNVIQWDLPQLSGRQQVVLNVEVKGVVAGIATNSASVTNSVPETTLSNNSDSFTVNILEDVSVDLSIPTVVTANGDGKNDSFKIVGLQNYANNSLSIFNRWGTEVFRTGNGGYQNDWTGANLNEGTYYYLLKLTPKTGGSISKTGWLTLIKN